MNFSPCFDKKTPILWKHNKDLITYVAVELEQEINELRFNDKDFLFTEKINIDLK